MAKLLQTFQDSTSATRGRSFMWRILRASLPWMCIRGATLTIYPMTSRKAAINYIFRNDREKDQRRDSGPEFRLETLVLNEQTGTFFDDEGNKISSLCADHYYQPITDNYPSSYIRIPSFTTQNLVKSAHSGLQLRSGMISSQWELPRYVNLGNGCGSII